MIWIGKSNFWGTIRILLNEIARFIAHLSRDEIIDTIDTTARCPNPSLLPPNLPTLAYPLTPALEGSGKVRLGRRAVALIVSIILSLLKCAKCISIMGLSLKIMICSQDTRLFFIV